MKLILDTNVLCCYYKEFVLEKDFCLTDSTIKIINSKYQIVLDNNGLIEQEWKNTIDPNWVDSWVIDKIYKNELILIKVLNFPELCRSLYSLGMPIKSKDIKYIKLAKSTVDHFSCCTVIISEDIDLYNPKKKNCNKSERLNIIKSKNNPIQKLMKSHNIIICCVLNFNSIKV